ncbi:MAG: putative transposase [Frankiales bacterium]|nr:putative transposase [Frankiales bacterium]
MRGRLSVEERAVVWQMVREGSGWSAIARALERHPSVINTYAHACGGIEPRVRTRRSSQLSLAEREEISRGVAMGWSLRQIATQLGRAPSTVSREVARNGGLRRYRAVEAEAAAWVQATRPKASKIALVPELRAIVEEKLAEDWSPEQIARWLRRTFPDRPEMQVSHETIYVSLFVQARGALRKELTAHLRSKRPIRRGKTFTDRRLGKGQIIGAVHISQRPAEAKDRAVPGHWEGDLLLGSGNTQIATLVERQTRFVMLVALPSRTTDDVVPALAAHVQTLPDQLKRSLTWDRGKEMAKHAQFTIDTGVQVYFCDPRAPWQRGSNENTNGLLRQYFAKRTSMAGITQDDLNAIAAKLNGRPRKTLDWMTPSEKLNEVLR